MSILGSDASTRVLVFSTWADLLSLVSHALHANGIQHVYPRSKQTFDAATKPFRVRRPVSPQPPSAHDLSTAGQPVDAVGPASVTGPPTGDAGVDGQGEGAAPPVLARVSRKRAAPLRPGESGEGAEAAAGSGAPRKRRPRTRHLAHSGLDPPDVRVLLLLTKQGANGLNLTEAQHVVLVEPQVSPAVEAQAIGRVDRIGQTRETWVHRFVVEASIEENVHRLCSERAAAMDLSAAATSARTAKEERLTVRDVVFLLNEAVWAKDEAEFSPQGPDPLHPNVASPEAVNPA
eukprot:jgi/Botrbrau1/22229/Bobra.168_1s0060.1